MTDPNYVGREQTLVKHAALRAYLERFAFIVGSRWETLLYIDCFSGPWNVGSSEFRDSSFAIAIAELRKARDYHREKSGRVLNLRCFFIEKEKGAFEQLRSFLNKQEDIETEARNLSFEEAIPEVQSFITKAGARAFPFIFIDPTGWTGFRMNLIAPLLSRKPCEVLVNFMTGHIRRFLQSSVEHTQENMEDLFGASDFRERLSGLRGQDREDAAVFAYANNLKKRCGFEYVCVAVILNPEESTSHFHLVYGTRNIKGAEVFKTAEKKAMEVGETARAEIETKNAGSGLLFPIEEIGFSKHYGELRVRYLNAAKEHARRLLASGAPVPYDKLREVVFGYPLVWESDLKSWVALWQTKGLEIVGKGAKQRVPKPGQVLQWAGVGASRADELGARWRALASMTTCRKSRYLFCVKNAGYEASLERRKVYRALTDTKAEGHGLVRVTDESGEDYLYPADCFVEIVLPKEAVPAFAIAT